MRKILDLIVKKTSEKWKPYILAGLIAAPHLHHVVPEQFKNSYNEFASQIPVFEYTVSLINIITANY